jgi:hypothetical protein
MWFHAQLAQKILNGVLEYVQHLFDRPWIPSFGACFAFLWASTVPCCAIWRVFFRNASLLYLFGICNLNSHNFWNWAGFTVLVSWFIRKGYQDFVHIISMDLYHPFLAYVLQFFSLISDSLDGVTSIALKNLGVESICISCWAFKPKNNFCRYLITNGLQLTFILLKEPTNCF